MRYLILFFSLNLFASNWMTEADILKKNQGLRGTTTYASDCGGMYQIDNCKPDICTIQDVEVDDTDKPIYSKENVQACEGQEACQEQLKPVCEIVVPAEESTGHEVCHDYCEAFDGYAAYINEDYTETYCVKLIGYQKKIVKQLKEDAGLKAAKAARLAAEAQAKIDKENKKLQLETSIDTCLTLDPETAKAKDAINCILPLIKYVREHK